MYFLLISFAYSALIPKNAAISFALKNTTAVVTISSDVPDMLFIQYRASMYPASSLKYPATSVNPPNDQNTAPPGESHFTGSIKVNSSYEKRIGVYTTDCHGSKKLPPKHIVYGAKITKSLVILKPPE